MQHVSGSETDAAREKQQDKNREESDNDSK